jgi:hypothetical protein
MEDNLHPFYRPASNFRIQQIPDYEIDTPTLDMFHNILQPTATEVVHRTHTSTPGKQRVHQMRANEGRPASDQDFAALPVLLHGS